DGTPIYARTYRYTPVPVPEEIADSIISFETMVLEQWLPRGRAEEAAREHLIIPESFPPISNVVLGRDDSVWLRKEDSGETKIGWNANLRAHLPVHTGARAGGDRRQHHFLRDHGTRAVASTRPSGGSGPGTSHHSRIVPSHLKRRPRTG